jgi:hypothetical protein
VARAAEAPARATEASGSAVVVTPAATTVVRRALEEEEAGLLHLEVSDRFSRHSGFEGLELKLLSSCSQGITDRPRPRAC